MTRLRQISGILLVILVLGWGRSTDTAVWAVPKSAAPRQPAETEDTEALLAKGRQLFLEGSMETAGQVFRRLIPRLRDKNDLPGLASSLNALSFIDASRGDYVEAASAAREAASIRESLHDSPGRADSLTNLGLALFHLGEYGEALACYRSALSLYQEDADLEGVSIERNNIGNVLLYQGRYLDALKEYQRALELVKEHANQTWSRHEKYRATVNLAALHQKLGSYQRALDLYSGLEEGVLSAGEQALVLSNQGALFRHLGDAVKALRAYEQAQRLFQRERNLDGEIGVIKNIGIAKALDLGDLEGALSSFQKALDLAAASGNQREELQCRLYRGETLRQMDRVTEARQDWEKARRDAADLGAVEEEWKAIFGLGRLEEKEGRTEDATRDFQLAIDKIESVRSRLQLASLTPGFLGDKRQAYDALIHLLSRTEPVDDALFERILQLVEKARSQAFLDQFSSPLEALNARSKPERAARLRELRAQAAAIWKRLPMTPTADQAVLRTRLASVENDYLRLEREIEEGTATDPRRLPALKDLQKLLPAGGTLVEYWVGSQEWVALAINGKSFHLTRTAFPDETRFGQRECVDALRDPSSRNWESACAAIGAALLNDLPEATAGTRRLILVPDQFLHAIPFEVLATPGSPPLLERFEIEYLPTAALLAEPRRPDPKIQSAFPWSVTLLAFGNPLAEDAPTEDGFGESWQPLPFSAEEVRRVSNSLPGRADIRLGKQARKGALLQDLSRTRYPIIHFATHAVADPVSAERSRILLSASGPSESYDFLFLGEVLTLPLGNPGLVVLSACDTARGKESGAAGVENFGRAFLLAGARSVVATSWKVSDQATADFMDGFYSYLSQGEGGASALRKAKLRFFHSGKTVAHPYYWAGFTLYGEGFQPLSLPVSWTSVISLAVIAAGALLSLFLVRARRRG